MRIPILLALCSAAFAAVPSNPQRIVGGSVITIDQRPENAVVLGYRNNVFQQMCGGVIINNRSVLTAAHCTDDSIASRLGIRVGSTWANSGGVVHSVVLNLVHPLYYALHGFYNNLAILRSATTFTFNNNVRTALLAGPTYNLPNYEYVWASGWGSTSFGGFRSEQLRQVQLLVIDQATCRDYYAQDSLSVTDNQVCAGWPFGGRDQCDDDAGGPLYHNGVVVGIFSRGLTCGWGIGAWGFHPGINTRVSRYSDWIQNNA